MPIMINFFKRINFPSHATGEIVTFPFEGGLRATITVLVLACSLTTSCSQMSGWQTESASTDYRDNTRVLAELIVFATRDEVMAADSNRPWSVLWEHWPERLSAAGYSDADIVDGSEAVAWSYCFAYNNTVPLCSHYGYYPIHIPLEFRDNLAVHNDGDPNTQGDLVEIQLVRVADGSLVGKVVDVYRRSNDWSPCRTQRREGKGSVTGNAAYGRPQGWWIECEGIESDGWIRQPVDGTPPGIEPPVSQWIKLPN
jgi:hypothetical protein